MPKTQNGQMHHGLTLEGWQSLCHILGSGEAYARDGAVRLVLATQDGTKYSDTQLDDYSSDGHLRWQPPVRLSLRARFSHPADQLRGTCGFGFWNDPLGMTTTRRAMRWLPRLRLPQTVWFFFASPPSNLPWAIDVPGHGWKVATLDASSWPARMLLPFTPIGMLLCRVPWIYFRLWRWIQKVLMIDEKVVKAELDAWHDYRMEWRVDAVRFWIDDVEIFRTERSPRGPLGLVIWIDNQYMVATPQGKLRHGLVATNEQWLEIAALDVTKLDPRRS